jgi:hypothetical protein
MSQRASKLFVSLVVAAVLATPLFAQRGGAGGGPAGGAGGASRGMSGAQGRGSSGDLGRPDLDRSGRTGGSHRGMNTGGADHGKTPGELLAQNERLASRLSSVLPPGTDLQQAAVGFKNLGQFVAAAHVSKNLNIPFEELKSRMTGPEGVSLGKAIKELKPDADAKAEAKRAKKQAETDLEMGRH